MRTNHNSKCVYAGAATVVIALGLTGCLGGSSSSSGNGGAQASEEDRERAVASQAVGMTDSVQGFAEMGEGYADSASITAMIASGEQEPKAATSMCVEGSYEVIEEVDKIIIEAEECKLPGGSYFDGTLTKTEREDEIESDAVKAYPKASRLEAEQYTAKMVMGEDSLTSILDGALEVGEDPASDLDGRLEFPEMTFSFATSCSNDEIESSFTFHDLVFISEAAGAGLNAADVELSGSFVMEYAVNGADPWGIGATYSYETVTNVINYHDGLDARPTGGTLRVSGDDLTLTLEFVQGGVYVSGSETGLNGFYTWAEFEAEFEADYGDDYDGGCDFS